MTAVNPRLQAPMAGTPGDVPEIDALAINTIRTLSMDAVQAANSGHPGMPMGMVTKSTRARVGEAVRGEATKIHQHLTIVLGATHARKPAAAEGSQQRPLPLRRPPPPSPRSARPTSREESRTSFQCAPSGTVNRSLAVAVA